MCQVRAGQSPRNVKQRMGEGLGVHCSTPLHSPPLPWGPEVPGLFASSTGSHTDQQVSPPLTRGQASCSLFSPCFPVARMQLLPSLPFSLSSSDYDFYKNSYSRTSLVVQWLRTCLAVQGRWVQSLAGKLRCHSLQGN